MEVGKKLSKLNEQMKEDISFFSLDELVASSENY